MFVRLTKRGHPSVLLVRRKKTIPATYVNLNTNSEKSATSVSV